MPVIFHDDLESGNFSPEVLFREAYGAVQVVSPGLAGSYGGQFVTQPTLEIAQAQAQVNVDLAEIYVGAYFQINSPAALGIHDRFYLIRALAAGGLLTSVGVRREGDEPAKWCLWGAGGHTYGGLFDFTPRKIWVELHYNRALGLYEVFVDGHLEISMTAAAGSNPNVDTVQFGVYKSGATGTPFDPTTEYLIDVFSDELTIGNEYLGGPPQPPPCENYTTQEECEAANCYWYNGACHSSPQPPLPHCFIATAAYGTPFTKELNVLRSFRDSFMLVNRAGASLVTLYYLVSPPLAKVIANHKLFRLGTRTLLKPIVNRLKK